MVHVIKSLEIVLIAKGDSVDRYVSMTVTQLAPEKNVIRCQANAWMDVLRTFSVSGARTGAAITVSVVTDIAAVTAAMVRVSSDAITDTSDRIVKRSVEPTVLMMCVLETPVTAFSDVLGAFRETTVQNVSTNAYVTASGKTWLLEDKKYRLLSEAVRSVRRLIKPRTFSAYEHLQ